MGLVRMYHAASDRFQDASEAAFEAQWKAEGWVIADVPESAPVAEQSAGEGSPVDEPATAKPRARRS